MIQIWHKKKYRNYIYQKLDYNIYETNLIIQKCLEMGLKIDVSRIQYDVNKEKGKKERYLKKSLDI